MAGLKKIDRSRVQKAWVVLQQDMKGFGYAVAVAKRWQMHFSSAKCFVIIVKVLTLQNTYHSYRDWENARLHDLPSIALNCVFTEFPNMFFHSKFCKIHKIIEKHACTKLNRSFIQVDYIIGFVFSFATTLPERLILNACFSSTSLIGQHW